MGVHGALDREVGLMNGVVSLNVGGQHFATSESTLLRVRRSDARSQ